MQSMPAKHAPSPDLADQLHSACIRLLRRVRVADAKTGISAPKLSVLSVLVFAGAQSLASLARAEQVRPSTMSKLVADLEAEGLVAKRIDRTDRRGISIEATAKGRKLMEEGRRRRLALLQAQLATLTSAEHKVLEAGARLMLRLAAES